ncbi:transformation/transcription domain-associated protein [Cimex lectularius]|uniref:Transformation/transcription domain-associated protein n=1 Tax=Cimex lectularius TaxID=79782 RepID=A0A8I6S9C5_CIMLE|nr:transformation/transcription domain-associated protein [Cimex lectularius]
MQENKVRAAAPLRKMPPAGQGVSLDSQEQLNTYISHVKTLADPGAKDENKLQAAQELSENFELILSSPQYPAFLDHAVNIFLKILQEGDPHFIAEYNIHQVRKLLLEMIYRIPTNKYLKPYVESILKLTFKLLETENEQNVLVCLRIIIELHKHFRPTYNAEIQHFLQFVRSIYQDLPDHMNNIFEPKSPIRVKDLTELNLETLLNEIYTTTLIQCEKKKIPDGSLSKEPFQYNLIPRGILSLKVLQELPIIVVLMYELYKVNVHQDVNDYIPIIIKTITLQPLKQHRLNPAFNKEVFVDFMGAQIKTLSFLAYIIRFYQDVVGKHSQQMVEGMLGMLTLCPMEVTHLRKELLIAARHILATDLRLLFVPYMERLFDEEVLLGRGWTTHESLRPLAYSTLADLVHHVREQLPMSDLVKAVHLFSKNVHDETLPTSIQTISCKLLLNLVDCIKQLSEKDPTQAQTGQDLLMRMLEVFVIKFKTIAKLHLPFLVAKSKQAEIKPATTASTSFVVQVKKEDSDSIQSIPLPPIDIASQNKPEDKETNKGKFGLPSLQATNYTVADCRSLVKTLVFGVKTITWRFKTLNLQLFKPKETEVFIRLVKWALQALDIYTLSVTPSGTLGVGSAGQRTIPQQTVRTKEEKEVLEHFSGVFSVMNAQTFREIFSTTIEYMVERIATNFALQIVGNSFLSNSDTSPIFATVLVEYLLGRMEEMGNGNMERSNLYLKLFKLVFGSVSLFAAENEHMLKPHLHQIVNRSMELAMTAKEPYNYFLLLRTLFRSIGGGNHDLLYQEFLPLLPNLLQGLNSLQSGLHKQHMKDLFVELCLTVPVRLSSLLPYLPMLMDPMVSALNGSPTLISQGLRTLELCVDNLQPDFFYEHIQPVRADLMQALWRSLRNPTDQVAHVAFRVLGKFGGGNRKMMIEPQKLEYAVQDSPGPAIMVSFPEHAAPIELPVAKIIEAATNILKPCTTDIFYRTNAWEIVRDYLMASICLNDDRATLLTLLNHSSFKSSPVDFKQNQPYKCPNKQSRQTHIEALKGMFLAAIIKDLSAKVQQTFEIVVRHFTIVAVSQQSGPFPVYHKQYTGVMDPLVLIDALAAIMGHEEKELCNPGKKALNLILETTQTIVGSKDLACRLPLMEYIAERMCSLCYDRAWYTKLGGCMAIMFLYESMSIRWVFQHLFVFVKAQLFVMMDLTGEVSSGALDQAKLNLEALIKLCAPLVDPNSDKELAAIQQKALTAVTFELIKQVTSPTTLIREQSMHLLRVFAEAQNKTVVQVMEPHKVVLADMIPPPKNHLLRHQAANAQIGIMEGNTFCTTLTPRLFTIDLNIKEHNVFFHEIMALCEAQDAALSKMPCYKNLSSLVPLRKAAMRALAACHYLPGFSDKIFNTFYQSLEKNNPELQEAAFECMKTFLAGTQVDMNIVHDDIMKPLLLTLGDNRNVSLSVARRLSYLVQLFPTSFNEKLCEQLLQNLQKLLETIKQSQSGITKSGETENIVATIINIFHQIPAAGSRFIEPLSLLVLQTERSLLVGASSPFRHPLLKFLLRYPQQTINLLLTDSNIKDDMWNKYLEYIIKHEDGKPFRDVLQSNSGIERLVMMALGASQPSATLTTEEQLELQFQSIRIVSLLVKFDNQWIATQYQLAQTYIQIWCNDKYLQRHKVIESIEYTHWKEPKLIVKILLNYFSHHPSNIDLLFQLLRSFCDRFLPDFQFVKDFLETTVAQSYTIEWKRMAFFRFVELFPTTSLSQDLKAKILQLIIIPCFAHCFEKGEGDKLIGGPPSPKLDSPDNIVSVFINQVIDPNNPFGHGDAVRIRLLQLSCLLVEQALEHIHDTATKTQGDKLRRLMTFAWPCLLSNNCVDPATRYNGHLLFSHIIAKLAIHTTAYKRIVLKVFYSLLKAHAVEVRPVVRQALEILTPAMPDRMENGYKMFTHWTKKIIVEEGHSMQQLFHILQLVVRHYNVYYPVRYNLLQHMVNALQRLGFSASSTLEHKKLGCELAEVIIRWELQRIKEEAVIAQGQNIEPGMKRGALEDGDQSWKKGSSVAISIKHDPDEMKPLEKSHADVLINFLMRLACSVNELNPVAGIASPGEVLSRRCYNLIRMALKPDVWPNYTIDFRLLWLDKIFCSIETPNPNLGNICIGLELLTLALSVMKKEQILAVCKTLQKGINTCISSTNNKIIRLSHSLLTRLMKIFPTESSTSSVSSKYEELECIYSSVGHVVFEGLTNYEQNTNANSSSLFGTIMMLKAACSSNPSYVDRLINHFVRVIHRMSREHLAANTEASPGTSDLLILSLDLVKNRVIAMTSETKKTFIGSILVGLIEKTPDVKVMKAICNMVEEWMKNTKPVVPSTIQVNTGPSLREKSILLVKLMHYVEKRFPDLNTQFLELVNFVYRDETFKNTELIPKLEPAFLAGLRCSQPQIRAMFFEIFDGSMRRKLHERLMYIVSSQNWELMGQHYWIKQCIELILVTADENTLIQLSNDTPLLPSITSLVQSADPVDRENFLVLSSSIKKEELVDISDVKLSVSSVEGLVAKQADLRDQYKPKKTLDFLAAVTQLCHLDSSLAEKLWLDLYPRLWNILSERQRTSLSGELLPFIVSGCHTGQKDIHPSALSTIFEGLSQCNPPLPIKPVAMAYLGKSHNLWHRVTLTLEKMIAENAAAAQNKTKRETDCYEFDTEALPQQNAVEYLAEMYSQLREEDMWCALWQKHARYKETCVALAYEQQGFFDQALSCYELAISKGRQDYTSSPAPISLLAEQKLWEKQWIRCSKELNQWDHLLEYARTKGSVNTFLILESAWRVPDWSLMKDAIAYVETGCPRELCWKVHLYRGFLTICHPEEQHLPIVERYVELASSLCMREWRRLPHIVSHIHLPLLQAAQQIMELQEACQIHQGMLQHERTNSLHDMKTIVKTWRNRIPIIADDLSHWSDVFTWRQHHYQFIASNYDAQHDQGVNRSIFGVHDSCQAIIHFGKIARKQNLTGVCQDSLSRIYTIPTVPVVDCFQNIRQQVKCYLQMASQSGQSGQKELQEGLKVVELTELRYFTKEMTSECYALKGMLLSQIGRVDEASKAFSAAVQLHDTLVKAWALWGDFIESQFTKSSNPDITMGISAITCFLHACRHQNESKSRKYLAKVLWLLTYDDEKFSLTEAVDKYVVGVPPIQWLPWIPQLLTCLMRNEGIYMLNLLSQVGRMFPQAVYFPIRTLYYTLKIEQLERYKSAKLAGKQLPRASDQQQGTDASGPFKATPSMWRCGRIMHTQMDAHPTVISFLEGIVDQMVWFRENWDEEVLRQLRQGLAKCYVIAFENRGAVSEATITPHTLHFVKKLVATFGGIENTNSENTNSENTSVSSAASESLAKRAQITSQDPVFQKMKSQFSDDFDFSVPNAMKLQNLIHKLKKWVKILEGKTKLLPKSFLIEENCRLLSNFSLQTAEIELPGEFLLPKHSHYYVRISRFMPRVEIVQKHNTAARRLFIRGHNGKIYPYLVVNDSGLGDARREERVLQLLRMLNHYLGKQKETSRRFLHITVPRVVAVYPLIRLVEDNPSSISLLDVYKGACASHGIEHDAPVTKYYERLASVQARGMQASHQILKEILKDVQTTMIPKTLLKDWALKTYLSPTDFWTFRKMMTLQLALACFCEYVLHLTRLNPDMLYVHQDSGLLNVAYFKFDIEDTKGELDANRPVPFRLTPNIQELLTETGVNGPLTASIIATARCLAHPNFKVASILRAILRDEMIYFHRKKQEKDHENLTSPPADVAGELIINMVSHAVNSITQHLNSLAQFDGTESKVGTLVNAAKSPDNLCRMDPAWHPWL